ncbi:MAG: hypothetical protein KGD68_12540 [Candidatus Lokiarchaeota archaeon]|nr:hypothetical protein [Candidatus Lokiarchaeota archaeon]
MKNKKYCIVLIIFSLLLTISLINIDRNIDSWLANDKIHLSSKPMQQELFKVGVQLGPIDLDPQVSWDSASGDVIDQVCEGLFAYNLSDPDNSIIPRLATADGVWSNDNLNYTVTLRDDVTFHDGTAFNASAVQWNWERMDWCLNETGTNHVGVTQIAQLYVWPDGTPFVDHTEVVSEYVIKFVLNAPYAPFQALLCFSGSYIQSPASTDKDAYLVTASSDLVGTGPFVYDNYIAGIEVNFHAFDNYWRGKANITEMRFQIISDPITRHAALLTGDVHFISATEPALYSTIKASPNLTFLNTSTTSTTIWHLGMNNQQINLTIREAISYAIDYDHLLNDILEKNAERLMSPIPNGVLFANDTFDVPILNFTRSRLVMQSMGFGTGFDIYNDAEWINQENTEPFLTYNYTYNSGNTIRERIFDLLQDNLTKIGIRVTPAEVSYIEFVYRIYEIGSLHRNMLQLYWLGWGMDYNDPSNFINTLFANRSTPHNIAQYNGYTTAIEAGRDPLALNDNVQLLMEAALSEFDSVARKALYDRIQELLIEEDCPWAWGIVNYIYHAYDKHLTGFQQNAMNKFNFYPCEWISPILPGIFIINSDADDPDTDGNFNITWSLSAYADNYSLYLSSSIITEINESVTVLLDEVTDTSYEVSGYSDGNYYFLVVARNGNGNTTSSNLLVNVDVPDPPSPFTLSSDADSPDANGNFTLTWTPSNLADNYSLYGYSSLITEINGSLILLLEEVTDLTYEVFDYLDGTYFFVVVAKNAVGTTFSNNIEVVVKIPVLPSPFTLSSDAGSPDANGNFTLTWTPSTFADNYSLYGYSSLITEINGSLILLLEEVTDLSYEAFGYSDGTYFFAVVAKNADGTTLSNNIEVVVEIEEPWIPGFELWTMIFTIISVGLILLLRKKKKYT